MSKKIDEVKLKEIIKSLNTAMYDNAEEESVPFLTTKIKTIGSTPEKLMAALEAAIGAMDDDVASELPEAVIDFYNEYVSGASSTPEPTSAAKAPAAKAPAAKAPAVPAAKAKAPTPAAKAKTSVKKEPAGLSIFGHKLGSQAAKLDALLAPGKNISLEDLVEKSGRSSLGVKGHIKHLIESRKLDITVKDNMYKFIKK